MQEPIKQAGARPATKRAATASPTATPKSASAKSGKHAQPAASAVKPSKAAAPVKTPKVKKPKMVRDSFTIPKDEYGVLDELKQRCNKLAQPSKKSELLRAGIQALASMSDKNLLAAVQAVPSIKTGRPKKA